MRSQMLSTPTITVCSDASYRKFRKKRYASWACYIRTPTKTVKTSGLIKSEVISSTKAELYGVANALYLADQLEDLSKFRLIVYCDNYDVLHRDYSIKHTPKSKYYEKELEEKLWHDEHIVAYTSKAKKYEPRHVKGHLSKHEWSPVSKRNYMNDWCDREAYRVLREKINEVIKEKDHE